ncbi:MAG: PIG-L family deacetylase [Nocardiaceae bacterium]|nr:PIG-L family deacetylase [Nocardiaceae bacterium]
MVTPHPDDEILGIGGLLSTGASSGIAVDVVSVTDGEAARMPWRNESPTELAAVRRAEVARALVTVGVGIPPVRLRRPDGRVADFERELARELVPHLSTPDTWCFTTWRHDGHPDHEATSRACASACEETGARLVEFPVWMWHWATPGHPRVPWDRARTFPLGTLHLHAKREAVACFASQLSGPPGEEIVPPHVLAHLVRNTETVFV